MVLDADVLLRASARDLFLYLAALGVVDPVWSEQIMEEVARNFPDPPGEWVVGGGRCAYLCASSRSADALFLAMKPPPPKAMGWWLLSWPDFQRQFDGLLATVESLRAQDPDGYAHHPKSKLLATILRIITEGVPRDPGHSDFRHGGKLGSEYTGWFPAKFHQRFRLCFRFDSQRKAIIYGWVNTESGLRQEGGRNDPYVVFRRMLERGQPPTSFDELLREARGLRLPASGEPDP